MSHGTDEVLSVAAACCDQPVWFAGRCSAVGGGRSAAFWRTHYRFAAGYDAFRRHGGNGGTSPAWVCVAGNRDQATASLLLCKGSCERFTCGWKYEEVGPRGTESSWELETAVTKGSQTQTKNRIRVR
jgi:hypothetical protein